jgi:hypothetical protein
MHTSPMSFYASTCIQTGLSTSCGLTAGPIRASEDRRSRNQSRSGGYRRYAPIPCPDAPEFTPRSRWTSAQVDRNTRNPDSVGHRRYENGSPNCPRADADFHHAAASLRGHDRNIQAECPLRKRTHWGNLNSVADCREYYRPNGCRWWTETDGGRTNIGAYLRTRCQAECKGGSLRRRDDANGRGTT